MGFFDGLKAVGGGFVSTLEGLGKNISSIGSQVISVVGTGFTTIIDKGTGVVNTVVNAGTSIINKGIDVGGGIVNKGIDLGGGIVNKGVDIAGGAVNTFSLLPILAIGGGIYLLSHLINNAEPVGRAVSSSAASLAPLIASAAL